MLSTALGQDGVDWTAAALPHRLRRLDEAWLTVSGIEYEVGAPAIGQLRDFEQIDFTFQSRFPLAVPFRWE